MLVGAQRGQAPLRPKVLIYCNNFLIRAVIWRIWSYIYRSRIIA